MKMEPRDVRREGSGDALRRTSRELRRTIGMVEDLEDVVAHALATAGGAGAEQMLELQKLDHIQQKILGVADFIDALSGLMSPHWMVDAKAASRCVLLAELGAKLGDPETPSEPDLAPETYELF
jgi:hypothetical protein